MTHGNWDEETVIAAPADEVFARLLGYLEERGFDLSGADAKERAIVAYNKSLWRRPSLTRFAARIDPLPDGGARVTLQSAPALDTSFRAHLWHRDFVREVIAALEGHQAAPARALAGAPIVPWR